jgi:LysM repeat protein
MTVTIPEDSPAPPSIRPTEEADAGRRPGATTLDVVCPYLGSADGRWRSAAPSREQRCSAVGSGALLALAKQRSLCLAAEHRTCAAFLAARRSDGSPADGSAVDADQGLWPRVRTVPMLLDPMRGRFGGIPAERARVGGQAVLVGLMGVAFVALVLARVTAPPIGAGGTPAPPSPTSVASGPVVGPIVSPGSLPSATASPIATPTSSPAPTPEATPAPSLSPTPRPAPTRTYVVQSGDTLYVIAQRFGTTVKAISEANGITDPSRIRIGQVLAIP